MRSCSTTSTARRHRLTRSSRRGSKTRSVRPRTPAPNRPSRSKASGKRQRIPHETRRETGTLSVQDERKKDTYHFDRHTPEYRLQFEQIAEEMQAKCPVAWTDTYNGHWVAADSMHVFELARC